jgi:hypothetical protein
MSFMTFICTFWPLVVAYVLAIVVAPILLAITLSTMQRRRDVRCMHRLRRAPRK